MALPLPVGLGPAETAFVCEMESVTIIARQRLDELSLLGGPTPSLVPPRRAVLPLWFAILLKRQRRANIVAPDWLSPAVLNAILELERTSENFVPSCKLPYTNATSSVPKGPPFIPSSTVSTAASRMRHAEHPDGIDVALPYHWLEMAHILLRDAADDIGQADTISRLIRDLKEVRMAKLRSGISVLEGTREIGMNGVGGLEISEARSFIAGVIDGLRVIGASAEVEQREREAEEGINGGSTAGYDYRDQEDDGFA